MYIWCKIINKGQICPNGNVDAPRASCKIAHLRALHLSTRALTIDISMENFISTCTNT